MGFRRMFLNFKTSHRISKVYCGSESQYGHAQGPYLSIWGVSIEQQTAEPTCLCSFCFFTHVEKSDVEFGKDLQLIALKRQFLLKPEKEKTFF